MTKSPFLNTEETFNRNIKICFTGNLSTTFIKKDYEILKNRFNVDAVEPPKKKSGWLKYTFVLAKKVGQSDLTFSWFAGWHSAFAVLFTKLFRKKSVIVAGGYDVANAPEIKYGAFTNLKEKIPSIYVLQNANLVLAVSKFTKKEILDRIHPKRLKVVYNGVNIEKFSPSPEKKEKIVVTIGGATKRHCKLKGLETFARSSVHFPGCRFVIIGSTDKSTVNELKRINPKLVFTEKITHDEVMKWLQRAKIYCQLSYIESFGLGNAEAMSCGCIPVVTNRGGMPEVVGRTGFYVQYGDVERATEAIKKALNAPGELGEKARKRIVDDFSMETRARSIYEIINDFEE